MVNKKRLPGNSLFFMMETFNMTDNSFAQENRLDLENGFLLSSLKKTHPCIYD